MTLATGSSEVQEDAGGIPVLRVSVSSSMQGQIARPGDPGLTSFLGWVGKVEAGSAQSSAPSTVS